MKCGGGNGNGGGPRLELSTGTRSGLPRRDGVPSGRGMVCASGTTANSSTDVWD